MDICVGVKYSKGSPGGSVVKNPLANAAGMSLISGLERSPGEGNGNSFQCFFLGNPMDRGVCQATDHGITESQKRLSTHTLYHQAVNQKAMD